MDFAGARSVCASILSTAEPPGQMFGRHLCLTLSGVAEAGLGNHNIAFERLLAARAETDPHVALLDWYSRFWQRWALTNLWMSAGDLARAREEAELFVANATASAERTWQALAWETHAGSQLLPKTWPRGKTPSAAQSKRSKTARHPSQPGRRTRRLRT